MAIPFPNFDDTAAGIRPFTNNDAYNRTIDNRPLQRLLDNDNDIQSQISALGSVSPFANTLVLRDGTGKIFQQVIESPAASDLNIDVPDSQSLFLDAKQVEWNRVNADDSLDKTFLFQGKPGQDNLLVVKAAAELVLMVLVLVWSPPLLVWKWVLLQSSQA